MILKVYSDQPSFRKVEFSSGFNVVLAERTKESTKKDSRNGLGKTTLLEIIHFCLGSRVKKGEGLLVEPLLGWTFSIDIDMKGRIYSVHRNTKEPSRVIIEGDFSDWPILPQRNTDTGDYSLSWSDWNIVLGELMFGLIDESGKYKPSFRSLISYFVRKGHDAFSTPFEHHRKQSEWDIQVNNTFLLGLNWEYAQKWQLLKDNEKILDQLKQATKSGIVADLIGTIGELETEKVRLDEEIKNQEAQLKTFKVHPQYRQIEEKSNKLTVEIHKLSNRNVSDKRLLEFYENGLKEEAPASEESIIKLYYEAKIVLPENVVKQLQEVQEFHKNVISNRIYFLQSELKRIKNNIAERQKKIMEASDKRAALMSILNTHKALEEYTKLQKHHSELAANLEDVKTRIENLKKFEKGKSALRIEFEQLQGDARIDYEERKFIRERAISLFNTNSQALYEVPGKLIIDIKPTGYKFNVEIERSTSHGISNMKIFCYDLMLAQLWSEKNINPGFIIHDSTIFDGVDERQIAFALQSAEKRVKESSFQYICCLNSDLVPWKEFEDDFKLRNFISIELTDDRPDGGLLGFRF